MPQEQEPVSAAKIVAAYEDIFQQPLETPDIAEAPVSVGLPKRDKSRPCALLLTPHPDDECLTGILPLRLRREGNWQVVNIGVTLGSKPDRRAARKKEMAKACAALGFECTLPVEDGLSDVKPEAREADAEEWSRKVGIIAEIIGHMQPQAVFMPHAQDWHPTHIGTHHLGMDALARMPNEFTCAIGLTEYWQPMAHPNALVGASAKDAARLVSALACHVGEVTRNGYDRRFPAYLIDAVRRSERVLGSGKKAPGMTFAELYGIGLWAKGKHVPSALSRVFGAEAPLADLFE